MSESWRASTYRSVEEGKESPIRSILQCDADSVQPARRVVSDHGSKCGAFVILTASCLVVNRLLQGRVTRYPYLLMFDFQDLGHLLLMEGRSCLAHSSTCEIKYETRILQLRNNIPNNTPNICILTWLIVCEHIRLNLSAHPEYSTAARCLVRIRSQQD